MVATEPLREPAPGDIENCRLAWNSRLATWLAGIATIAAAAVWVNCQFVDEAWQRFLQGYLVAFALVLSVSLGCLFFVLVQHLMRAGWSVVVRRFAEIFGLNMVVVALLFLPIGWSVWQGDGLIYGWSKTDTGPDALHSRAGDTMGHPQPVGPASSRVESPGTSPRIAVDADHNDSKPWLHKIRFLGTWAILFVVWTGIAIFYYRNSVSQDQTGDVRPTRQMEWWSGIAIILFGYSLTIGTFDLLMSLDPEWYSTIFGVYYFSGCAVSGFATLLLVTILLTRFGLIPDVCGDEVQRDLGRLLFAFVFFWAYIGFSQYMLLWYANMPETTHWLVKRGMSTATGFGNSWGWLAVLLLVAHFIVPFGGIMSRHVKSNSKAMVFWAVWLLVIHYCDLYWIVIPETNEGLTVSFIEIGTALSVTCIYGLAAFWIATRANLFAAGDPRIKESLTRQALY